MPAERLPQVYINSMRVTEPSRFFVLSAETFARLMREWSSRWPSTSWRAW